MVDCGLVYMITLYQIYDSLFNKRNGKTLFLSSKLFVYLSYNTKGICDSPCLCKSHCCIAAKEIRGRKTDQPTSPKLIAKKLKNFFRI